MLLSKKAAVAVTVVFLATSLAGCVGKIEKFDGYDDGPSKINFTITDARPAEDKETSMLSVWATSCELGIWSAGDDTTRPSRLEMLRQDIEHQLGDKVANSTLTVTRYRIFWNSSRQMLDASRSRGLIGAILTPDCTKDKTALGWYDPGEVTTFHSPIVIEIKASYKGKDYDARAVLSPEQEIAPPPGFRNTDTAPSVYMAIEKAHRTLIDQLPH